MDARLTYILFRLPDDLYFKVIKLAHEETLDTIKTISTTSHPMDYLFPDIIVRKVQPNWADPAGGWGALQANGNPQSNAD